VEYHSALASKYRYDVSRYDRLYRYDRANYDAIIFTLIYRVTHIHLRALLLYRFGNNF